MKFPDELLRQVTLGTFFQTNISHEEDDRDNVSLEAHLLLQIVSLSFQQQAGFVVKKTVRPLKKPSLRNQTKALNTDAVGIFIKLINGGVDVELLPEWCRLVFITKQHLPDEFAPLVLSFGNRLFTNRAYLRGILSEKAVWLAQDSQKEAWQWVLTTSVPSESDLLGIPHKREAKLIEMIYQTRPNPEDLEDNILPHFAKYLQPWSGVLAGFFLEDVLFNIRFDECKSKSMYLDALECFAYYAPMEWHHHLQDYLSEQHIPPYTQERLQKIQEVMQLRKDIHQSIGLLNH